MRPALVLLAAVLTLASCSSEQRRELGEQDVRDFLSGRIEQVADEHGVDLSDDVQCSADISPESELTASCVGTTTNGEPVAAALTGSANADDEECVGDLTVTVGSEVTEERGVACFDVP